MQRSSTRDGAITSTRASSSRSRCRRAVSGPYIPTAKIFNTFGIGPNTPFPSWEANIEAAATNLARPAPNGHYIGAHTIRAIGTIWAPSGAANDPNGLNNEWVKDVTIIYSRLGGRKSIDALVKSAP